MLCILSSSFVLPNDAALRCGDAGDSSSFFLWITYLSSCTTERTLYTM